MNKRKWLFILVWLFIFIAIPILSIYGRQLQYWSTQHVGTSDLALCIGTMTLLFLAIGLTMLFNSIGNRTFIHLIWAVPLFILLPMTFPIIEERIHFLVFGSFGFLSVMIFSPLFATVVSISIAVLDEVLQWVLPDRVGDWRDVGINTLACLGGIFLAYNVTTNNAIKKNR